MITSMVARLLKELVHDFPGPQFEINKVLRDICKQKVIKHQQMTFKQILQLKDKKVVYVLEENYSTYTKRKQKVNNYTLTLVCRRRKCQKLFHKINKLRY